MADIGDGSTGACLAFTARMQRHGGITWGEYVINLAAAHGIEGLTEAEIDHMLWEETAWPMADVDYIRDQLIELFARRNEEAR